MALVMWASKAFTTKSRKFLSVHFTVPCSFKLFIEFSRMIRNIEGPAVRTAMSMGGIGVA